MHRLEARGGNVGPGVLICECALCVCVCVMCVPVCVHVRVYFLNVCVSMSECIWEYVCV